jgi:hypothetical protein
MVDLMDALRRSVEAARGRRAPGSGPGPLRPAKTCPG